MTSKNMDDIMQQSYPCLLDSHLNDGSDRIFPINMNNRLGLEVMINRYVDGDDSNDFSAIVDSYSNTQSLINSIEYHPLVINEPLEKWEKRKKNATRSLTSRTSRVLSWLYSTAISDKDTVLQRLLRKPKIFIHLYEETKKAAEREIELNKLRSQRWEGLKYGVISLDGSTIKKGEYHSLVGLINEGGVYAAEIQALKKLLTLLREEKTGLAQQFERYAQLAEDNPENIQYQGKLRLYKEKVNQISIELTESTKRIYEKGEDLKRLNDNFEQRISRFLKCGFYAERLRETVNEIKEEMAYLAYDPISRVLTLPRIQCIAPLYKPTITTRTVTL